VEGLTEAKPDFAALGRGAELIDPSTTTLKTELVMQTTEHQRVPTLPKQRKPVLVVPGGSRKGQRRHR
jgi:hypothetical protein